MADSYQQLYEDALAQASALLDAGKLQDAEELISIAETIRPTFNARDEYSMGQRTQIGLGQGFTSMAQGGKQAYLMGKGALDGTGMDEAKAYTQQINQERERWHSDFPGVGMESLGVAAANITPAILTAGMTGPLRGAVAGGLEAGLTVPTEDATWEDKVKQTAIGTGLGFGAGMAGGYNVSPGSITEEGRRALIEINTPGHGGTLRPGDLAPGSRGTQFGTAAALAQQGSANRVIRNAYNEVQDTIKRYSQGDTNAYEQLGRHVESLTTKEADRYDAAFQRVGSAMLDVDSFQTRVLNAFSDLIGQGGRDRKTFEKMLDEITTNLPQGPMTVEKARQYRTNLRKTLKMFEREHGIDQEASKAVYQILSDETMKAAHLIDPVGAKMLGEANELTILRASAEDFYEAATGSKKLAANFRNMAPEQVPEFVKGLGQDARKQLVADIYETALKKAQGSGRAGDFSPRVLAGELEKYRDNLAVMLPKDEAKAVDGMIAYLNTANNSFATLGPKWTGFGAMMAMGGPLTAVGAQTLGVTGAAVGLTLSATIMPILMRNSKFTGLARRMAAAKGTKTEKLVALEMDRALERIVRSELVRMDHETQRTARDEGIQRMETYYGKGKGLMY